MRIGILTRYYPPEVGAPQARLSHLASTLARRQHDVFVLTAMPNYPLGRTYPGYGGVWRREHRDGVEVLRSYIYPTQRAELLPRLTNYFSFVGSSAVFGTAALPRLDYLLTESPPLFLATAGYTLSKLKRARWIFNVSDLWPESAVRVGVLRPGSTAHRLAQRLEAFSYRHAWLVTGQSRGILADINTRFPQSRTYHLSNGADTTRFHPSQQTADARQMLVDSPGCVGLYAGLHGLAQKLAQILDAAEQLREHGVKFVLVGDGPERRALMADAERRRLHNVRFLESRPAAEMPALVASADFMLVTLSGDIPGAVPSKMYEAMASGRPVILVATGEPADIIMRHEAGLVVAPGDIDGLARAVRQLSTDDALRRELGENGRRAAVELFDRTRILERFATYLESDLIV